MDNNLKIRALSRLALSKDPTAEAALEGVFGRAATSLSQDSDYDVLAYQLEVLGAVGHRRSTETVIAVREFIERVQRVEITHSLQHGTMLDDLSRYRNAPKLIERAIGVLESIRYLETGGVLKALLAVTRINNDDLRKRATTALEAVAGYNIPAFHGTQEQRGVGASPQLKVLDVVVAMNAQEKRSYFPALVVVLTCLLSPTMAATSATYQTVTFATAAVPATTEVIDVRRRALVLLTEIYGVVDSDTDRVRVVEALAQGTRTHHQGKYGDDVLAMIMANTKEVLEFYRSISSGGELPVLAKIEHQSYWIFRRGKDPGVIAAAKAVKEALAANPEYQIYRVLSGPVVLLGDWTESEEEKPNRQDTTRQQTEAALELARSVYPENFQTWRERLLHYAKLEIQDSSTLAAFLGEFAVRQPDLALLMLNENAAAIGRLVLPLMRALWGTDRRPKLRAIIERWVEEGRFIAPSIQQFQGNDDLDAELLRRLLLRAIELNDLSAVNLVIAVAVSNYRGEKGFLIKDFVQPALSYLSEKNDARWAYDFWFRPQAKALIDDLDADTLAAVLASLLMLDEISYEIDEILYLIARRAPNDVLRFFMKRLNLDQNCGHHSGFDAIPFDFHKVQEPLARNAEETVAIVRSGYSKSDAFFQYRGGRLLHNIFPEFSSSFEAALIALVKRGSEDDISFVAKTLRAYDGQPFIHEVCKEVVRSVPEESDVLGEIAIALESTGVVVGEMGFVEAWQKRVEAIRSWLSDPSDRVKKFAEQFIENLSRRIEDERKRVSEDVTLRKLRYGE